MKYGVLAGNSSINSRIYEMFESIDPNDIATFVKKFRSESDDQKFHTFRELILGAELCRRGLKLRYEKKIGEKTPDWTVLAPSGGIDEILDVATLHQRRAKDLEIGRTIASGRIWAGWVTVPPDHIYSKIQSKADSYANLAVQSSVPYTVCLFGEFTTCVDPAQIEHVLYKHHGGIFHNRPGLAGVLYFHERSGTYHYSHFPNHSSAVPSKHLARLAAAA
jgi:hypothetical protein